MHSNVLGKEILGFCQLVVMTQMGPLNISFLSSGCDGLVEPMSSLAISITNKCTIETSGVTIQLNYTVK